MYNCMIVVINFGETTREVKTRIFLINFCVCVCAYEEITLLFYWTYQCVKFILFYKLSWTEEEQLISTVCIIAFHSAT